MRDSEEGIEFCGENWPAADSGDAEAGQCRAATTSSSSGSADVVPGRSAAVAEIFWFPIADDDDLLLFGFHSNGIFGQHPGRQSHSPPQVSPFR